MYKRILLAYDGSEPGQQALLDCHEIAQWSQAELFLIAVRPLPLITIGADGGVYDEALQETEISRFKAILDAGLQKLADVGIAAQGEVVTGDPVDEIVHCARRIEANLIVVGHKHLDGWAARWWRGSISRTLIEHAPCSVLVVITH